MIVYGCMNGKLKNKVVDEISVKRAYTILRENNINIKSLPGYGNMGLRKKDIQPYVENKSNEKLSVDIPQLITLFYYVYWFILRVYGYI